MQSPEGSLASHIRWIVVFSILLLACSAAPVLAASTSEPSTDESQTSTAEKGPTALPTAEDIAKGIAEAEREGAERSEELAAPEAVREREASRNAYSGLGAAEAEQLLSATFSRQLATLNADPARFLSDATLDQPLGEFGARITDNDGNTQLLESSVPVRVEGDDGQLRKLDLTLTGTDEGFTPAHPLVDLTIGESASEGVEVGKGGLAIAPVGTEGAGNGRLFGDKNVFYPEAMADTDLLASPTSGGVELFDQLRSERSPQTLRFHVDLPLGAALRSDGTGGAAVVSNDGATLASVPAPDAQDAQGTHVPVELEVGEDAIVLAVNHREADFAYPILVDPEVQTDSFGWYWGYDLAALENENTWYWNSNDNAQIAHSTYCIYTCWEGSHRGLYVSTTNANYAANQYGQWAYTAPGETTYIPSIYPTVSASLSPFYRDNHGCNWEKYKQPHDYDGVWEGSEWTWFETDRAQWYGNASIYTKGKTLIFGLGSGGGVNIPCWRDIMLGGVTVAVDDPEAPTINSVEGTPSGWVSDATSFTITAKASDPGLGIRLMTIAPQGKALIKDEVGCTGLYSSRCPASRTHAFKLTGTSFGEGERSAKLSAEDPTAEISKTYEWQTKVDRSPPEVDLEGQLAKITAQEGPEENEDQSEGDDELRLSAYNLDIEATDGSTASPEAKRSGVKSIEVFLDKSKTPDKSWTQSCPESSCEMAETYTLNLTKLVVGAHTLRVVVKDQVENPREREIEFSYIPATGIKDEYLVQRFPLPDGQGDETEEEQPRRPELAVNVMNGNLVYRERDIEVNGPAIDLEVERYYNSMLPDSENTEWGDGWTLAQTPQLEPEETEEEAAPDTASMVGASGTLESTVGLPTETGEERFDSKIQAVVTKEPGGGYELIGESGETDTPIVFDGNGEAAELRTGGEARIDYGYEEGELSEIAVDDPASTDTPPAEVEEPETEVTAEPDPAYLSSFGEEGAGDGQFDQPGGVAVDSQGGIWVVDQENNRIQRFDEEGQYLDQFGSYGSGNGQLDRPAGIAIDAAGDIWVADAGNSRIEEFDSQGTYLRKFGSYGSGNGQLSNAEGIAIDPDGDIWVADTYNSRLQKLDDEGNFIEAVGSYGYGSEQFVNPTGIDVDSSGNVWVADWTRNSVFELNESGEFIGQLGSSGKGDGQFEHPDAVVVDVGGYLWVGDEDNDRIQVFDETGEYLTQLGTEGSGPEQFDFHFPMGIAIGPGGNLWVADAGNNRLQEWRAFSYTVSGEGIETEDDPQVDITTSGGLVTNVEGEEAGQFTYEHEEELLTAVDGPQGETTYGYDEAGRLSTVELPNGTTGVVTYDSYGRVGSVTVDPAGTPPAQKTVFEYSLEPRRTTVTPPEAPVITYDISEDGSVAEWWNSESPPTIDYLAGTLAENMETQEPITIGDHTLEIQAHSEEGIASIDVIASGDQLVHDETCEQTEEEGIECKTVKTEWVTYTGNWPPGILQLEVMVTDRLNHTTSEGFWINVPYTPPPDPEAETPPSFEEILSFREAFGLDLDLEGDEIAIHERIFDLIGAWYNPQTPAGEIARAAAEHWGVPLRTVDVAELEYRDSYIAHDGPLIAQWGEANAPSTYAGYYVDHRAGGLIYVGFTENQASQVEALKSGLTAPDRVRAFPQEPTYSATHFVSIEKAINEEPEINGTISGLWVDTAANNLVVDTTDPELVSEILTPEYGSAVLIHEAPPPPEAPGKFTRFDNSGRVQAGDYIEKPVGGGFVTSCTAGFGAWDEYVKKANNERVVQPFILTAGHCFPKFGIVRRTEGKSGIVGEVRRNNYVEEPPTVPLDAEAIKTEWGLVPRYIYISHGKQKRVAHYVTPEPGQTVCASGVKTNKVRCGPVLDEPRDTRSLGKDGKSIIHTIAIPIGVQVSRGDSGGPTWLQGTGNAVGLITAAAGGEYGYPFCLPYEKENYKCPIIGTTPVQEIIKGTSALYNAAKLSEKGLPEVPSLPVQGITVAK